MPDDRNLESVARLRGDANMNGFMLQQRVAVLVVGDVALRKFPECLDERDAEKRQQRQPLRRIG